MREDLIKEILKFCLRAFECRDMIGLIVAEEDNSEDTEANADKPLFIAKNIVNVKLCYYFNACREFYILTLPVL